jgi:hypothetical protein
VSGEGLITGATTLAVAVIVHASLLDAPGGRFQFVVVFQSV